MSVKIVISLDLKMLSSLFSADTCLDSDTDTNTAIATGTDADTEMGIDTDTGT